MTSEWQTMDSAPKTGGEILIYVIENGEMFVAGWSAKHSAWQFGAEQSGRPIILPNGAAKL